MNENASRSPSRLLLFLGAREDQSICFNINKNSSSTVSFSCEIRIHLFTVPAPKTPLTIAHSTELMFASAKNAWTSFSNNSWINPCILERTYCSMRAKRSLDSSSPTSKISSLLMATPNPFQIGGSYPKGYTVSLFHLHIFIYWINSITIFSCRETIA